MAGHSHAHSHDHSHDHSHGHHHHHDHGDKPMEACCSAEEQQSESMIVLYLVGGMLLIACRAADWVFPGAISPATVMVVAFIAAVLLSFKFFVDSFRELRDGFPREHSLAALAILGCFATQEYETAGWVSLVLLLAAQVLRRTAFSAKRIIEQLVRLTPNIARVVRDGSESEVALNTVRVNDIVRVRAGENLPIDGIIVSGRSTLDQASLTGEAMPHEVNVGDQVYAGTTNLSGAIDIRVTQVGEDTTIGKVTQLISAANRARTPRQLLIEQVARFYVPVVISLAALTWFLSPQEIALERAITVLFVACPTALLLSSPTALVAAFAAAARLGVMIKEARFLEAAGDVDTVIFDKTGTITTGKFAVARLAPATGVDGADLLAAAASGEQQSNHPLARSILATAAAARITPDGGGSFEEIHGRGVKAVTSMGTLHVGRGSWLAEQFPDIKAEMDTCSARIEGMTGVHVARDGKYLGVVGLEDRIRTNVRGVIDQLRTLGVKRVSIFTGDRLSVAQRVGQTVGADTVEAECLPAEKHEQVLGLSRAGRRTLMVGDGINDGPSLAAADVGVAMGLGGSDIATNSAGVALMNDELSRIPFMIELSRMNRSIITQNIAISVIVAVVGLALAATGRIEIIGALIFHFLGDIVVVLNSFRLFRFGEAYAEQDAAIAQAQAQAPVKREASMRLTPATA